MARIRIEDLPQTGAEDELSDKDLESVAGGGENDSPYLGLGCDWRAGF